MCVGFLSYYKRPECDIFIKFFEFLIMIIFISLTLLLQNVIYVTSTSRPIIGVMTQEFPPEIEDIFKPATSYIAASYVKALEAAGARVVPIFIKQTRLYYKKLLKSINGVVVPGGEAKLDRGYGFYDTLITIYELVIEMNDANIYFPLFGVCLGFEALLTLANNHTDIQTFCGVYNENSPLEFTDNYQKSLLYSRLPKITDIYLKYLDTTKHNHGWCITPHNFSLSFLPNEWVITSENINKRSLRFISSVEHKKYPIIAIQFHAEKHFEWTSYQNNPHSRNAILANRHFYDRFVDLSKLNHNKFKNSRVEFKSLIYNYAPEYSLATSEYGFHQMYLF